MTNIAPPAAPDQPEKPKLKLKPAEENPWYCLMTLHGPLKQSEGTWLFDKNVYTKNRLQWNKWASRALTAQQRKSLLEMKDRKGQPSFSAEELTPHSDSEWAELAIAFEKRAADCTTKGLPSPDNNIDCDHTLFIAPVYAHGFLFPSPALFSDATFLSYVDLSNATTLRIFDLSGATFLENTTLSGTTFGTGANLSRVTFTGYADLSKAIFSASANFSGSTFSKYAGFSFATFSKDVDFIGTEFSRKNQANFVQTVFCGQINFLNAELDGDTSFARAVFQKHPPSFHGAKLNEGTAFDEVTWPDPPTVPMKPVRTGIWQSNWGRARNTLESDIKNYQRLKQMMETLKKHEDELEFFAREMACKRVLYEANGETAKAWLLGAYDQLSDYGRSVARPTWWLLGTLIYSAVVMAETLRWGVTGGGLFLPALGEAFNLTYANLLAPLNIRKDFFDATYLKDLPTSVQLISGFQTIAGVFFSFLIGLALRNRFRMK